MKNLLYGSTALVAVGILNIGSSNAADKIKMGVGGYFSAYFVYASQDDNTGEPGANRRNHGLSREGEIIFNGRTRLDNGVQVGVQVQLEAETCNDQIDESFMWFSGRFGRINIGAENSAAYLMHYAAPEPTYWSHGLNSPNFQHPSRGTNATFLFPHTRPVNISNDAEKITYFTPRFAGVQLGVSYTPDVCEEASAGSAPPCGGSYAGLPSDTNGFGEAWEFGVNYVNFIGDLGVRASASYGTSDNEVSGPGRDDPTEWSIGGQVSYAGFTIGGAYTDRDGLFGFEGIESKEYNFGVHYRTGPWGVGVTYAGKETATPFQAGEDELDAFEIGGSYAIGPGVVVSGGVQYWDMQDDAGAPSAENQATIGFIGTHVAF